MMDSVPSDPAVRLPEPGPLAGHWSLHPSVVYLNHGSFGATPSIVLEAQSRYRERMEQEPVRFFMRELWGGLDRVRGAYAEQCGGDAHDYVMLHNATHAAATVFENRTFEPGDEILVTNHGYPACTNNAHRAALRSGARVVEATIPFPVGSNNEIVEAVQSRVSDRTRLAMLDHVTSPTGLVLPIERLVRELESRGIDTLVDGAHAPGMLEVDLGSLRPAYYTANAHKWFCAPKGSALLWVRPDLQEGFRPLALSNYARGEPFNHPTPRSRFNIEFDYAGTDDVSAFLATPDAIQFVGMMLPGRWPEIRERNRSLALEARSLLARRLGVELPAPDGMIGSIATVPLPRHEPDRAKRLADRPSLYGDPLQDALVERWRIQVPVWSHRDPGTGERTRFVRLSAQLYNAIGQYEYLAEALETELERERSL